MAAASSALTPWKCKCTSAGSATGQQLRYEAFDRSAGLIEGGVRALAGA
jgi:hypothetical protein